MTAQEITDRVARAFKGVPNFTSNDAEMLVIDAMTEYGYAPSDSVPNDKAKLIILTAQINGAYQIAFSVAHYFRFTDGEESVDKSMISENYRELARDLKDILDEESAKMYANNFKIAPRIDRPNTTPPTGDSSRGFRWRRY